MPNSVATWSKKLRWCSIFHHTPLAGWEDWVAIRLLRTFFVWTNSSGSIPSHFRFKSAVHRVPIKRAAGQAVLSEGLGSNILGSGNLQRPFLPLSLRRIVICGWNEASGVIGLLIHPASLSNIVVSGMDIRGRLVRQEYDCASFSTFVSSTN